MHAVSCAAVREQKSLYPPAAPLLMEFSAQQKTVPKQLFSYGRSFERLAVPIFSVKLGLLRPLFRKLPNGTAAQIAARYTRTIQFIRHFNWSLYPWTKSATTAINCQQQ